MAALTVTNVLKLLAGGVQRADLLLARGDPTREIADLAQIEKVFVRGVRLRRHGLSSEE